VTKTSEGKAAEVERLIAPSLFDMGYGIVRVQLSGERRAKLQVMIERHDGEAISVEDCARISRAIEAMLDVADPIAGAYVLEVSSPGIDRPLTRLGDFERFAGFDVRVEMRVPIAGRRRFRGRLLGLDGARVRLATEDGEVALPFADMAKAKLILTDELMAAKQAPSRT
jgi:ribosome maturation factor RimP